MKSVGVVLRRACRVGRVAIAAVVGVIASLKASAGLVAKWDFDNYDPANPASAAILEPTVGNLAMIPCTGSSSSTEVTDGTLGSISVVNTGLPQGDYALSIPRGAHLKVPIPAGIVRDKNWMLRLRFYSPAESAEKLRAFVGADLSNPASGLWFISLNNVIQGNEGLFGASDEENRNDTTNGGVQKDNGTKYFRLVSSDAWHSFTAVFGATGTSSTLNGYRSVSMTSTTDVRAQFTGDGFILCGGGSCDYLMYIASVEVWDDVPIYHRTSSGYITTSSTVSFSGCSLNDICDLYLSVKGLGSWGPYARVMSSWEHIVTTDGEGNATDLKVDFRGKNGSDAILCEFANNESDVNTRSLRMQWSLVWPNPYFTSSGEFTSSANYQTAPSSWDGGGYSPYNLYALPFRPLDKSLNWSMQMGSGKFGNPVFTIVGDNPTLTFDVAPDANSITLDCGRGIGRADVSFAYASDALKTMSTLRGLNVNDGVALTLPQGVAIPGPLALGRGASVAFDAQSMPNIEDGQTLLTATGGITLPEGVEIGAAAFVDAGTVELADDDTKLVYRAPPENAPITAVWIGGGDRNVVNDPLNWTCWNYLGVVLDGAVPNEYTSISVTGSTTFNVPTGQTLTYRSLSIESCSLAADCDWCGLGVWLPFANNAEVDLNGNSLTVGGLFSENAATITNSAEDVTSELCVMATVDSVNSVVLIAGNVKFVKDGTAKFTSARGHTYTGGSELLNGVTSASLDATQYPMFGVGGSQILVRNATLELGGQMWFTIYRIVLDGGTISSAYSDTLSSHGGSAIIGTMALLSDSTLQTVGNGSLRMWNGPTINLGGHTLSLNLADSTTMVFGSDIDGTAGRYVVSNGTVAVSGGTFRLCSNGTFGAKDTNMRMNGAMHLTDGCTINVGGYEALYEGDSNTGTGAMNVYGTFIPVADGFYGCTLQDGATLDLSGKTGTWSTTSKFTTGANTATFAENATITVNLSGRSDLVNLMRNDEYVVTWTTPPSETVVFRPDENTQSRALALVRDEGGLKLASTALMILVR